MYQFFYKYAMSNWWPHYMFNAARNDLFKYLNHRTLQETQVFRLKILWEDPQTLKLFSFSLFYKEIVIKID